ncbi:hypothetical protein RFX59_08840 [Acinetobacter baumannii]|nr:hypothetical protein [Acinetobacter baumannii]MDQ9851731.1 hypothetical protein [Acinetobacter baumannii]
MRVNKKQSIVGFDRYVMLDWLDQTAMWVIEGKATKDIHALIDDYLAPYIQGDTSKRKTKNVLSGAWVKSDGVNPQFKAGAQQLYIQANQTEKLVIHYGLMVASYPFFYSLCRILGRLFKLQDDISNEEFYRRVVETHGDRESIKRAAARFLQSLNQWGVLDASDKAKIKSVSKIKLNEPVLVTWLFEAAMYSNKRETISLEELLADPAFFSFEIPHGIFQINQSDRLEIAHQGVHETIVKTVKYP